MSSRHSLPCVSEAGKRCRNSLLMATRPRTSSTKFSLVQVVIVYFNNVNGALNTFSFFITLLRRRYISIGTEQDKPNKPKF